MVVKIEGIITIKIGLPFSIGDIVRVADYRNCFIDPMFIYMHSTLKVDYPINFFNIYSVPFEKYEKMEWKIMDVGVVYNNGYITTYFIARLKNRVGDEILVQYHIVDEKLIQLLQYHIGDRIDVDETYPLCIIRKAKKQIVEYTIKIN